MTTQVLKPAAENPWYVLATLAGEQSEIFDQKIHNKNQTFWNAWFTQNLTHEERNNKDAQGNAYLTFQKLPEWEDVQEDVKRRFQARLPGAEIPDPEKIADFSNLKFTTPISFQDFWFNHANFSGCNFAQDVIFINSISNHAIFYGSKFCGVADFGGAQFLTSARFYQSVFCKRSSFHGAIFASHSDFRDTIFEEPCNMRRAKFLEEYPNLDGADLHSKTNVTAKEENWPSTINEDDEIAVSCCAILRQNMTVQGRPDDAHFFLRREMDHKAKLARWWDRPFFYIYGFSEYGYGVWQPIWGIILLFLVGAVALFWWGCMDFSTAAGLSFNNIFKFLGFQRVYFDANIINSLNPWLKFMTGAQTFVGYFLLFLMGLGLRNRFRLK